MQRLRSRGSHSGCCRRPFSGCWEHSRRRGLPYTLAGPSDLPSSVLPSICSLTAWYWGGGPGGGTCRAKVNLWDSCFLNQAEARPTGTPRDSGPWTLVSKALIQALEACPHSVTPRSIQATWDFLVPDAVGPGRLRPHTWSPFPGDVCGAARLRTHCPRAAGKGHRRGKKHLDRGKERLASRLKEKWPAKGSGGTQHRTPSQGLPS